MQTTGRSRRLADDGRHFIDPAVRFAGVFVSIVNAIFSVAQQAGRAGRFEVATRCKCWQDFRRPQLAAPNESPSRPISALCEKQPTFGYSCFDAWGERGARFRAPFEHHDLLELLTRVGSPNSGHM